jgi:hypothetical protein
VRRFHTGNCRAEKMKNETFDTFIGSLDQKPFKAFYCVEIGHLVLLQRLQ